MKILILEQNKDLQQTFRDFFESEGYEVLLSQDITTAEKLLNKYQNNLDIILCDLDNSSETTNSDNLVFLKHIQKNYSTIPFVFLTTSDKLHKIIDQLNKGIWSYLVKPILNLSTLLLAIEQLSHQQHLLTANHIYKEQLADKHKELEDDHIAGSKIHKQLLPLNNIEILNLHFSYFLHPSLYISGDFIDYQKLSDRYVIFYLSDVAGHGISSAFVTVLLKACVSQYCSEFIHMGNNTAIDPKIMLDTINQVVCRESLGKYLTMVYMVYDAQDSKITYSVAGHFPFPVYIEQGKSAKYIGERGYPIGMFKEASYVNYELELADNFKLAIFSDGLIEVRPEESLEDKEQSIIDILSKHHDKELEHVQELLAIDPCMSLPDDICGLFVKKI